MDRGPLKNGPTYRLSSFSPRRLKREAALSVKFLLGPEPREIGKVLTCPEYDYLELAATAIVSREAFGYCGTETYKAWYLGGMFAT